MLTMMMMKRRRPAIGDEDDAARVRMMMKMMHREVNGVGVGGWVVEGMMMMRRWCKMALMMMPVVWGLGRDWKWRWWCAGGGADDDGATRSGGRRGAK